MLILRFWKEESLPGGAGNTAANVRALGGVPARRRRDRRRRGGRALSGDPLAARGIRRRGSSAVGRIRDADEDAHPGRRAALDQAADRPLRPGGRALDRGEDLAAALRDRLRRAGRGAHGGVLSDYGYGAVSPAAVADLRERLAPGRADPRRFAARPRKLCGRRRRHAERGGDRRVRRVPARRLGRDARAGGRAVRERLGCPTVLVTRGSRGMALFDGGARPRSSPFTERIRSRTSREPATRCSRPSRSRSRPARRRSRPRSSPTSRAASSS